jgi:hypothetical protein
LLFIRHKEGNAMIRIYALIACFYSSVLIAGCSVGMAMSGQKDPNLGLVRVGATRGEVEMTLGGPIKTVSLDDGKRMDEYEYEVGDEPSAGRAVGHAVLDILTLGIWEVVGTPIEGFQGKKHRMTVIYGKDDRAISINQPSPLPATKKQEYKEQQVTSLPSAPPVSRTEVIRTDENFEKYANGVVRDTSTRLEWVAGPDEDTTWYEARDWVQGLSIDGGGWRMPTVRELEELYEEGKGYSNMTPLLKTTGGWVWSGETVGSSSSCGFNFTTGQRDRGRPCHLRHLLRGFAVRSQSAE